jgi:hypothetical protein
LSRFGVSISNLNLIRFLFSSFLFPARAHLSYLPSHCKWAPPPSWPPPAACSPSLSASGSHRRVGPTRQPPLLRSLSLRPFSPLACRPTPLHRTLRALAPGRCRTPCPLRCVARLDPSLSLLHFFPQVPEHFSPFLQHGAAPSLLDRHRAHRCRVAVGRPDPPFSCHVAESCLEGG